MFTIPFVQNPCLVLNMSYELFLNVPRYDNTYSTVLHSSLFYSNLTPLNGPLSLILILYRESGNLSAKLNYRRAVSFRNERY